MNIRVPDAVQRATSAFTRVFDALCFGVVRC